MATLQSKILKYLESLPHCWCVKTISANKDGCPDILACYKSHFLAIEVKEGSGRLSGIQKAQFKLIAEARGFTTVARHVDDVKTLIRAIDIYFV